MGGGDNLFVAFHCISLFMEIINLSIELYMNTKSLIVYIELYAIPLYLYICVLYSFTFVYGSVLALYL